jgi:hypothetical protein
VITRLIVCMGLIVTLSALGAPHSQAQTPRLNPIASEPLYADIVNRAQKLRTKSLTLGKSSRLRLLTSAKFKTFGQNIEDLSSLNLKAHLDMKARGTDTDLKCVLMGVSRDLPKKLNDIKTSKTDADLKVNFERLSDLLRDNIEVITIAATSNSGMDCIIEFGEGVK